MSAPIIFAQPALNRWALAQKTRDSVPAFRKFLAENGCREFIPETAPDTAWKALPWTDKANYISRYLLTDRVPHGRIPALGHASSGSSGTPTYWFRGSKQKMIGEAYYSCIIDHVMEISPSERTLVMVCFAMGVWVAGSYTLLAFEKIAEQPSRQLTILSPGMEVNDICAIFDGLQDQFDNIVIAGYPAALDLLFGELQVRNMNITSKLHLITSGDKISEEWRAAKMRELGISDPNSIVNVYGTSDGGLLAIESPLSIEIRRKLHDHPELQRRAYGTVTGATPAIFQYAPGLIYFEEIDGELAFTADIDLPLVRYNLHDTGSILSHGEMLSRLNGLELRHAEDWKYPFVILSGRTDVALGLYGVKLFPEQIREALDDPRIGHRLSGSFSAYTLEQARGEHFCLDLELSSGDLADAATLSRQIASVVQQRLQELSSEYRTSCSKVGNLPYLPRITLYRKDDRGFPGTSHERTPQQDNRKSGFHWQLGRKPRNIVIHN